MKISYNWLKSYIPDITEPQKVFDILTYHLTEVEGMETKENGDTIFDINILPNRAHDLLSHQGIARELSGLFGISYHNPFLKYKIPESNKTNLKINIETHSCRRFSARIIRNIKVGPSPDWIVNHLNSIGERSINNVVDITNLLMYDCGHPVHAFDLRKIKDEELKIKNIEKSEDFKLIGRDEMIVNLKDEDIVITDKNGETLSLAGIKGGINSGISEDTTDILIEVANFDPSTIRKTARRIGVLSDSAKRFENDLSPEHASFAMTELSILFFEIFPEASFEDVIDIYPNPQEARVVDFTVDDVNKKLGSNIKLEEIETILKNYSFSYENEGILFKVKIPYLRLDLNIKEDFIEEIGRIYGYDKITPVLPNINKNLPENIFQNKINSIREDLLNKGYLEVMNYSFVKKGDIQVARGLKGKDFLRTNLTEGLKNSYKLNKNNAPLLDLDQIKIFEIGNIFLNDKEELHVAYMDKSGVKEFDINQYIAPEDNKKNTLYKSEKSLTKERDFFKPWSLYPFIVRDISLWADKNTTSSFLIEKIKENMGTLVVNGPRLFDTFVKEDKVSYAFRLVFQSYEKTLTNEEVEDIIYTIYAKLRAIKNIEIR